jgi:hypothetical protein
MPLIPALGRQRQAISEFEASLVYRVSSRYSQGYTEKPCLKKKNTHKKTQNQKTKQTKKQKEEERN